MKRISQSKYGLHLVKPGKVLEFHVSEWSRVRDAVYRYNKRCGRFFRTQKINTGREKLIIVFEEKK